jgi:hypothetical protein
MAVGLRDGWTIKRRWSDGRSAGADGGANGGAAL